MPLSVSMKAFQMTILRPTGPQGLGPDNGAMGVRRIHRGEDRLASKRMRPPLVGPGRPRALKCPTEGDVEYISAAVGVRFRAH